MVIASGSDYNVFLRHSPRHLLSGGEPCMYVCMYVCIHTSYVFGGRREDTLKYSFFAFFSVLSFPSSSFLFFFQLT